MLGKPSLTVGTNKNQRFLLITAKWIPSDTAVRRQSWLQSRQHALKSQKFPELSLETIHISALCTRLLRPKDPKFKDRTVKLASWEASSRACFFSVPGPGSDSAGGNAYRPTHPFPHPRECKTLNQEDSQNQLQSPPGCKRTQPRGCSSKGGEPGVFSRERRERELEVNLARSFTCRTEESHHRSGRRLVNFCVYTF